MMFCLFFICIGATYASDVNDNLNNTNSNITTFEEINENTITWNTEYNEDIDLSSNYSNNFNNFYNSSNFKSIDSIDSIDAIDSIIFNESNNSDEYIIVSNISDSIDIEKNISNEENITSELIKTNSNDKIAAGGDSKIEKLSQKDIFRASRALYMYVSKYSKLPNYITINNYKFSIPEFMYLLSKTILYKKLKISSDVAVKFNVKNPSKPKGTNKIGKLTLKNYIKSCEKIVNFIDKYNKAPNYVKSSLGKLQYQKMIYILSIVGNNVYLKNKLLKSIKVNIKSSSKLLKYFPKYARTSTFKTVKGYTLSSNLNGEPSNQYLLATKNCQSNDSKIISLSKKITKGCKTELQKATAIFKWVRNKISYSFYYNTKYGAKKTISKRLGNCVDMSHLIVALSRASGLASRYVHGKCKFTSGSTYGHVWAQIKVGNKWLVADATSYRNNLGSIKNWNTNSYKLIGIYSSLSF